MPVIGLLNLSFLMHTLSAEVFMPKWEYHESDWHFIISALCVTEARHLLKGI